jgi:RNA polymerase sigma factor (sigma-70 family)
MKDFEGINVSIADDEDTHSIITSPLASADGKTNAREKLYIKYYAILIRYGQSLGASREDAEDLAHETLLRALITKSDQFRPQDSGSLQAWAFKILRNLYLNARKHASNKNVELTDMHVYEGFPLFDAINTNKERYRAAGLSELETQVAIFYIDYDLKPGDIAYLMPEHSSENISRVIYRLKKKLRGLLND